MEIKTLLWKKSIDIKCSDKFSKYFVLHAPHVMNFMACFIHTNRFPDSGELLISKGVMCTVGALYHTKPDKQDRNEIQSSSTAFSCHKHKNLLLLPAIPFTA